ncbi:hypothetical protein D3OALGB2SA_3588 [Olavius algarvensis associated proteobacterium Delta 3]|nr:hypothetical protein D3OALGB2SA_3588 [Olavius algarvensis associated proteobacterium Delta 3]
MSAWKITRNINTDRDPESSRDGGCQGNQTSVWHPCGIGIRTGWPPLKPIPIPIPILIPTPMMTRGEHHDSAFESEWNSNICHEPGRWFPVYRIRLRRYGKSIRALFRASRTDYPINAFRECSG